MQAPIHCGKELLQALWQSRLQVRENWEHFGAPGGFDDSFVFFFGPSMVAGTTQRIMLINSSPYATALFAPGSSSGMASSFFVFHVFS